MVPVTWLSVGRVHEVAQVERAGLLTVAGIERQGGEEAPPRLAHPSLGPLDGEALLGETEVVLQRLGDDGGERVGAAAGLLSGDRNRRDRRRDECDCESEGPEST